MIYSFFDYADRSAAEAGAPFQDFAYIRDMCGEAESCAAGCLPPGEGGVRPRNLALCVAPRHYKTTFLSRLFPAWCLAELAPDCEFILTSYSEELAADSAMAIRRQISQPWHRALYPHLEVSREAALRRHYFRTTAGGAVYAAPMGGALTGFGAGRSRRGFGGAIIIDDPLKAVHAQSPALRRRAAEYYNSALKSRRNSADNTPIILVMQRLHPDDLIGWILKNEPEDWRVVCYPALRGGRPLNPMTTSLQFLEKLRRVAPQIYWAQYMQSPTVQGGNLIKLHWWKTYKTLGQADKTE